MPATQRAGATGLPDGAVTEDEADELLGLGPAVIPPDITSASASPATPARSGASGATVLNELVDEIEKDLERDLAGHASSLQARKYGHTVGCWVSPLADASDRPPLPAANRKEEEGP